MPDHCTLTDRNLLHHITSDCLTSPQTPCTGNRTSSDIVSPDIIIDKPDVRSTIDQSSDDEPQLFREIRGDAMELLTEKTNE